MERTVKRVVAVHDLSGFGRSSLAVVIPILASMGIQACPLPTAVLSTHTGGFEKYRFLDLTDSMQGFIDHWTELGIEFDCVYSGFLGSSRQIEILSTWISSFSLGDRKPLVVIDPVMGDDGKLYSSISPEIVEKMREFVRKADVITPNYTEAGFLLGENSGGLSLKKMKAWMEELSQMGPATVIITSVPEEKTASRKSVVAYSRKDGRFWKAVFANIPVFYPGTGDAFTSVITASLLQKDTLRIAIERAVRFLAAAIQASNSLSYPPREGILLERFLPLLNRPILGKMNTRELD